MQIPFVDLQSQYSEVSSEITKAVQNVFTKCNFILGDEVQKFEQEFAKYCNSSFAIGVANGTDAIHLALRALGIGPGDEVLVPANTFIATALGVTYTGATPVPVDVDPQTFLLDVQKLEQALTQKTKAIIPVHLYGCMMNLKPVLEFAKSHHLHVVEDAAQAHGAEVNGLRAGSVGTLGCFSFYPGKNLGCYGDGGLVTTNDSQLKTKLEALRNYGSPQKYHHPILGFNSRLDTVQAAILNVKLNYLDSWNIKRYEAAKKYNEALANTGDLLLPEIPAPGSHVFHLYVIRTKKRDALLQFLNSNGISAAIHYPTPIHLHGAYRSLGYTQGSFPIAEQLSDEVLSLPVFPELNDSQIDYIATQIKKFFNNV